MTEGLLLDKKKIDETSCDEDSEVDVQIKELKHEFHQALKEKPEILKYIERLHTIIRRQQKKLNKFYRKLKDHKFIKKYETESKECQTDEDKDHQPLESNVTPWNFSLHNSGKSVTDEVKEVAENALKHTSFVYEPTSGMYYDYNTGYYYNAELRMYYDGNSGKYLEYDESTKTYKYYLSKDNKVNITPISHKRKPYFKKDKNIHEKQKEQKSKKSKLNETEEGEITESSVSESEASDVFEESETVLEFQESRINCEPCIRIMVEETNVEKLKVGSLFVVTCKGGTMGREGDHAVLIPDINVSKHHAKFVFNPSTLSYYITDLGSRNGTWLDGERLSAALQESENFIINHGAILQIGSTKLLCHIHVGHETCSSCEPGLVQQNSNVPLWDSGVKISEYREQLLYLKKKFGVDGIPQDVYNLPGYEDRAELRRIIVGSSHSAEKTQTASVTELIPRCNKGFKMLSKMGWSEGQTLGKNDKGLSEPVPLESNNGKSGLGMSFAEKLAVCSSTKKKQDILRKTQKRYRKIEGNCNFADSE